MSDFDLVQLIDLTYELAEAINNSAKMKEYQKIKAECEQDQEVNKLKAEFLRKKELYEEIERFGKYHPDYFTIEKEAREALIIIESHPKIRELRRAEKSLNDMLYSIAQKIAHSVSKTILVPREDQLFPQEASCGSKSGCSTCSLNNSCSIKTEVNLIL